MDTCREVNELNGAIGCCKNAMHVNFKLVPSTLQQVNIFEQKSNKINRVCILFAKLESMMPVVRIH